MADEDIIKRIQSLSDLELAVLICLIAHEHCVINTALVCLDNVACELELIATKVFGLRSVVVECSRNITADEFVNLIISSGASDTWSNSQFVTRQDRYSRNSIPLTTHYRLFYSHQKGKKPSIVKVIIAKNLNRASQNVQLQALELMRTGIVTSKTSVNHASRQILFVLVQEGRDCSSLMKHINDYIFISHLHHVEDELLNLEESLKNEDSSSSVTKRGPTHLISEETITPIISTQEIEHLIDLSNTAVINVEVKRYQMSIISFLRLHRAVAGGITASATRKFEKLAKCLAPLHNLNYVTPALVALAAKKIYSHRIRIVKPEEERSMQWGSDIEAVTALLEGIGAEEILEEVLGSSGAEAPL
ncbi:hypothetical protein GcM1_249258 [Golovinomyces cichoracearum]|uniref:magnesium chelatase n=1 Tax=Golovinomyces cichoracearum TaxID=62708 RepID=A0A420ICB4_9PEZI|nr:hypothetical protein GcM1_249258 [Golovinomyces cichoracearum]